jgi:hypothetical protein
MMKLYTYVHENHVNYNLFYSIANEGYNKLAETVLKNKTVFFIKHNLTASQDPQYYSIFN